MIPWNKFYQESVISPCKYNQNSDNLSANSQIIIKEHKLLTYSTNINSKYKDTNIANKSVAPAIKKNLSGRTFDSNDNLLSVIQDLEAEYKIYIQKNHSFSINTLVISNNNKHIITGSCDSTIRVWDFWNMRQLCILTGHKFSVLALVLTNDDKYIISCSDDKTVRIWSLFEQKEIDIFSYKNSATAIAVTNNKGYIVSGFSNGLILIIFFWDGKRKYQLRGHTNSIKNLLITNDDKFIISTSLDSWIRVWNIQKGVCEILLPPSSSNYCAAINNNNNYIFIGNDNGIISL